MGRTIKELLNPQNHPAIWINPSSSTCSDYATTQFPTDQASKPVALQDDDSTLWDEFSHKMNEQVPLLNKYLIPLYMLYAIAR
mmetsp:Transcript_25467/g.62633  ORF Transcript_25467/g.62633 Transcript_25467/m.62633 type:complete len:83 (-) Transcript_25467:274-522(-)